MSDAFHENARTSDMAWYSCLGIRARNNIIDKANYSLEDNKKEDCINATDNLVIARDGEPARVEYKHLKKETFDGYFGVRALKTTFRNTELQKYLKAYDEESGLLDRHYLFRTVGNFKKIESILVTKTTKVLEWCFANMSKEVLEALRNPSAETEQVVAQCEHIVKAYPDAYFLRVPKSEIKYKELR